MKLVERNHQGGVRHFLGGSDIPWHEYLPITLKNGYEIHSGSFEEVKMFAQSHFQQIYSPIDPKTQYRWGEDHPNKKSFYENFAEIFLFKKGAEIIGFHVINLTDWSTVYHRNVSISKKHQNKQLWQLWFACLIEILKAHQIHRVECDVSPGNTKKVHVLNKMGFRVTGFNTSERWGAVMKFTKFLNSEYENLFQKNLCLGWLDSWQKNLQEERE